MSINAPITNAQLEQLALGLAGLDGLMTKDGYTQFRYDDETTWLIAKNMCAVGDAMKVFVAAKKSLARQHGVTEGMRIDRDNQPKATAFFESLDVLLEKEAAVKELAAIARSKLNVGHGEKKNPIPAGVLAKLHPVLE